MSASSNLRQSFFDGYLGFHPEEASTLGIYEGAGRLRDHGPEALEEERRWYGEMAHRLDAVDADGLSVDERIDHQCMQRVVAHHLHVWDELWCAVDWSLYPYNMVMAQEVHARSDDEWRAIADRVAAIPRFVAQHEANVERGMADGIAPDGALCEFFADVQIAPASRFLREHFTAKVGEAAVAAADAYDAHRTWLKETVLPRAGEAKRIGEDELRFRLVHTMGVGDEPAALIARGHDELTKVQELLVACAAELDGGIRDLDGVRALVDEMQKATIARDEDVVPTFRDYTERTRAHILERRLYNIPEGYDLGIEHLPPGFAETGYSAANWPAPLRDKAKLGHFMVSPRAEAHSLAWAADLSVHEGLPGHHLQSFWWQHHFCDHPAPVRFLMVHDQVAIPRNFWAPMLNIEGYAVYAEEVMRRAELFTKREELFVLMAHGVRAARLVADLSLHAGLMSEDEAAALLVRGVGVSESLARSEVRRYLQIPLQASTYLLGRLAIEDLADSLRAREGGAFELAAFHDRFFSFGPADPAAIRRALDA